MNLSKGVNVYTCNSGHPMTAVPVRGAVRSICVTCLRRAASGSGRIQKGCNVFRLVELITRLEASEEGKEFGALELNDVPGFDKLYASCESTGTTFNAQGLRTLARRIADRQGKPVAAVMGMRPDAVADCATRLGLGRDRRSA